MLLHQLLPERAPQLLRQFDDELRRALTDGGRALFVLDADPAVLDGYLSSMHERAAVVAPGARVVEAAPYDAADEAGGLWSVVARRLTVQRRLQRFLRKVLPDWLEVIPVAGKLLRAVVSTTEAFRTRALARNERQLQRLARGSSASALSGVRLLLDMGPGDQRVILVPGFEQASAEDLAGTAALIRALPKLRLLLVCCCRRRADGLPPAVDALISEAERTRSATRIQLGSAGRVAVAAATALADVDEASLRLLRLGAARGATFYSVVVTALAGLDELDGEERLAALSRRGVIETVEEPGVDEAITSVYRLPPLLLHHLRAEPGDDEPALVSRRYAKLCRELGLPLDGAEHTE